MTIDTTGDETVRRIDAHERVLRIREGMTGIVETLQLIQEAWEQRDWQTLGYADWETYTEAEFGPDQLPLTREQRTWMVQQLSDTMSTRAIAAVLRVGKSTVNRELSQNGTPESSPARRTGLDGKSYQAQQPEERKQAPGKTVKVTPIQPGPSDAAAPRDNQSARATRRPEAVVDALLGTPEGAARLHDVARKARIEQTCRRRETIPPKAPKKEKIIRLEVIADRTIRLLADVLDPDLGEIGKRLAILAENHDGLSDNDKQRLADALTASPRTRGYGRPGCGCRYPTRLLSLPQRHLQSRTANGSGATRTGTPKSSGYTRKGSPTRPSASRSACPGAAWPKHWKGSAGNPGRAAYR